MKAKNSEKIIAGKLKKLIDIPLEHLDALQKLAKADNRDLKNFIENTLISLATGHQPEANVGFTIKHQPANANTGASILPPQNGAKKTTDKQPAGNSFLEKRRNLKNKIA